MKTKWIVLLAFLISPIVAFAADRPMDVRGSTIGMPFSSFQATHILHNGTAKRAAAGKKENFIESTGGTTITYYFDKGVLHYIEIIDSPSSLLEGAIAKYGKPDEFDTVTMQNGFGMKIDLSTARWNIWDMATGVVFTYQESYVPGMGRVATITVRSAEEQHDIDNILANRPSTL